MFSVARNFDKKHNKKGKRRIRADGRGTQICAADLIILNLLSIKHHHRSITLCATSHFDQRMS